MNREEFISRADVLHCGKYDYSNVDYGGINKKIEIGCRLHGIFKQTPNNHLYRKSGCKKCGVLMRPQNIPKKIDTFISQSLALHKGRYAYDRVEYKTARDNVEILCKTHGYFLQSPNDHLLGRGCKKCANGTLNSKEFISLARQLHGDTYDYTNVIYENQATKVSIGCKTHGEFWQTPNAHLIKRQGCPLCKKSKGEKMIMRFLEDHQITYETPKTFNDCINPETGWHLYFDFWIPSKNLLIEFDGYQHFLPFYRDKFSQDSLKKRQLRDEIKSLWAIRNGYNLLRIKYTETKNISTILKQSIL